MSRILTSPSLNLLRDNIDFSRVPFSDRGSRLMVFLKPENSTLYIRLAERLTSVEPGFEAYLKRPPFIHDLSFVDENGKRRSAAEMDSILKIKAGPWLSTLALPVMTKQLQFSHRRGKLLRDGSMESNSTYWSGTSSLR